MSAGPTSTNIHQIGQTLAWCIMYDIAVIYINLRYKPYSVNLHAIMGWSILILTYIDILVFLIPYGFNISISGNSVLLYIHGIIGLAMMIFVVLQLAGGIMTRLKIEDKQANIASTLRFKKIHKYFGYSLAVIYKINIIWSWIPSYGIVSALLLIQILFMCVIAYLKSYKPRLENVIVDRQPIRKQIAKISSVKQLSSITHSYVIFGNYVYSAEVLSKNHPGGPKVIETVIGREVDRFIYGMYSSELMPQLLPYSHSMSCLQFVGPPIAQFMTPYPYEGFKNEVIRATISHAHKISQKTQIYQLNLVPLDCQLVYKGYTIVQQLGQYYSLTINDTTTRLYTTVNFLNSSNIGLMFELIPDLRNLDIFKDLAYIPTDSKRQTELMNFKDENKLQMKQQLLNKQDSHSKCFIPIMLKIYHNGKFTSYLKSTSFNVPNLKLSCPKGRGLELGTTSPGKIIILAAGTGLYPFCDFIDLLFKSQLLLEDHELKQKIIKNNPVLGSNPFYQYNFVFMIALNEPEDIHPITLSQLIYLSQNSSNAQIIMRVSKNAQVITSLQSKIQFTKDYFNKRIITQAKKQQFSRIWICGPPKLNSQTAISLLAQGFSREKFLLV